MNKKKLIKIICVLVAFGGMLTAIFHNFNQQTEVQTNTFQLSEGTQQEDRLCKVKEIKEDSVILVDSVENLFEVKKDKDYKVGDYWFITITREGIQGTYQK